MAEASGSGDPNNMNQQVASDTSRLFGVLHDASRDKKDQISELLKDFDVNVQDENDDGNTMLHVAVYYGYADIVKLLVNDKKVDVNIRNKKGETPLHMVLSDKRINMNIVSKTILNMLLGKANVNMQNSEGDTLLHIAVRERAIPVIKMLIKKKANYEIENNAKETPLDLAKKNKNKEIIDIFDFNRKNQVKGVSSANSEKTYAASGAKNSMHGTVYQLYLLMLLVLRALVLGYTFDLGTEVDEAEQFDDIVFKNLASNDGKVNNLYVQAKHKEKCKKGITLQDLITTDNDAQFSLFKYYKSYIKIKQNNKKGKKNEDIDFAICTNTYFTFDAPRVLYFKNTKLCFEICTDTYKGFFKEGQCYKLVADDITLKLLRNDFLEKLRNDEKKRKEKETKLERVKKPPQQQQQQQQKKQQEFENYETSLLEDKPFKNFIDKLIFVVGQTADNELVETELRVYPKTEHMHSDFLHDALYYRMFAWFSDKKGVWLTDKSAAKEMIGSIINMKNNMSSSDISRLYAEKTLIPPYRFESHKLTEILDLLSAHQIVNLIAPKATKLPLIQVAQALKSSKSYEAHDSFIFVHLSWLLQSETQPTIIGAFETRPNHSLLVIDCLSEKDDASPRDLTSLHGKLSTVTDENPLKKIILISPKDHKLAKRFQPHSVTHPVVHVFEDFTKETQKKFLEKEVTFQGQPIGLKQVIGETETELLQIVPLETLIGDEGLVIGEDQLTSNGYNKSYYIDRSLTYQTVIKKNIFQDKLDGMFKDEIADTELEFQRLCSTHPEANIHLIEKKDDRLIWVKSKGELTALRSYIDNDNTKACSEALFLDFVKQQRVVIISDSAGMGKSTVLDHISEIIKHTDQGTLILRIELNKHTKALQEKKNKTETNKNIFNNISAFDFHLDLDMKTKNLERELLKRNGKAVVMFDGFDEISPAYNELVLDFIQNLVKATEAQIWITTRPFMTAELEINLHQFSYTLKAFSKSNQIEFLTKYWKHTKSNQNLEKDQNSNIQNLEEDQKSYIQNLEEDKKSDKSDRIKIFAESIINMITKSINDKEREFTGIPLQMRMVAESFDDDKAKFLEGEKCLKLVDLYDTFIEKKRKVFYSEKNCIDDSKVGVEEDQEETFKIYEKHLRQIALTVIFPDKFVNLLQPSNKVDNCSNKILANLNRIGIVNVIDGKPYFIHRTFAEYFVAVHVIELLTTEEQLNEDTQEFIYSELLISKNYMVIRAFLNGLLAKVQPKRVSMRPSENQIEAFRDAVSIEKQKQIKLNINKHYEFIRAFLNGLLAKVQPKRVSMRPSEKQIETFRDAVFSEKHKQIKQCILLTAEEGNDQIFLDLSHYVQALPITLREQVACTTEDYRAMIYKAAWYNNHAYIKTLLQWARDNMYQKIVRLMLLATNKDGYTALMRASDKGHNGVGPTLLQGARDSMDQEILRLMFLAGNKYSDTARMGASMLGHNEVVKTLLQWAHDNIHQEIVRHMLLTANKDGDTTLMNVSLWGRDDVVETLLQWARDNMDQEIVRLMLLAGDKYGNTALMGALRGGHNDVVQSLLQWTRDNTDDETLHKMLTARNNIGRTALDWVKDPHFWGKRECVEILKEYSRPV